MGKGRKVMSDDRPVEARRVIGRAVIPDRHVAGGRSISKASHFPNHDAPNREKVASFLTPAIGTVTRLSLFQAGSFS